MRFHVVSLAHTHPTEAFAACAFTQKVVRFCAMMKNLGHEVILYAGEDNTTPCDEHVSCISEADRLAMVGKKHYTEANWEHPLWLKFNEQVIAEMTHRLQPQDFICLIGGRAQQSIARAFPNHMSVEFGIGYSGTFAQYRVFESYAWMHMVYGASIGKPEQVDGGWWDEVIPNQIDTKLFPQGDGQGDYYLYVGRLIDRKGYRIAQDVCSRLGKRLILAGPGPQSGYGEFVGEVGPEERAKLMGGAIALFAPTVYVEPFGTVTIEAMACGTPVICTDWGAFTETIEQDIDGFRCRTMSEFLKAAVEVHLLDRARIRARAIGRFSMETVARHYHDYFERLLKLWKAGWYELE